MEKVRLGIIGLGNMGAEHAYNARYNVRGAELVAICARSKETTDRMQEALEVGTAYHDYRDMLRHPGLDGVIVASPSSMHCEHIVAALQAGLHVFAEKPLALTLEEIDQIEAAWKAQNGACLLQLGFMRRFDPSFLDAKRMIDEGLIGEPVIVKTHSADPLWTRDFMVRYSKTSGGLFFDMTQHCFDISRWILGSEPKRAFALGNVYCIEELKALGDIDNGMALVEHADGKMAMYHSSRTAIGGYRIETEIVGTGGILRIGVIPEKNLVCIHEDGGCRREGVRWYQERFKEANVNEMRAFVDCIRNHETPSVGILEGRRAIEMALAIARSLESGQAVEL